MNIFQSLAANLNKNFRRKKQKHINLADILKITAKLFMYVKFTGIFRLE